MSQLKAELDHSKREVSRLKTKIEKTQETEGVSVDESLEQDLQTIMEEKISEIQDSYPTGSFLRLFWDQQLMARPYLINSLLLEPGGSNFWQSKKIL